MPLSVADPADPFWRLYRAIASASAMQPWRWLAPGPGGLRRVFLLVAMCLRHLMGWDHSYPVGGGVGNRLQRLSS